MFNNDKISDLIIQNGIAGVVVDMCRTLYINGIDYVHVGALMRLLGVDEEQASEHDDTYFHLDEDFVQQLDEMDKIDEETEFELGLSDESTASPTIH